jgi:hypothetical protein
MALFDRRSQIKQIAVNDEQAQAIARGSDVGSGAGPHGGFAKKRRGQRSEIAVLNEGEVNLPMDTAWIETRPTTIPYGARGRNPGGWPEVIPVGVPPAVAGEPHRLAVPKELRIPVLPTNSYSQNTVPVPTAAGASIIPVEILLLDVAFPIGTFYIHNMSTVWILENVTQFYVPPNTVGWVIPCYKKSSQINIRAAAPPGHAQPALTAGQVISVIATESVQPFSPGVACPVA